ncbi:unnamed protein product [Bursaphelenchus xylophilus]|uniref:(pine wood nematode) hypothetical protein n=1 Tax=Bursaphelenchus xylophilus TaxID=6326 RepID=A0A1I7SM80_BURXY|nr:unnamed protein product [Bursaphelenchus xylophilus]CAG9130032.1 unnamed protein product [Bursaphelenchus xylophilus]
MFAHLLYEVTLGGVNHSIPGNGGLDCLNYIPLWQRVLETIIFVPLGFYGLYSCYPYLEYPEEKTCKRKMSSEAKAMLAHKLPLNNVGEVLERVHPPPREIIKQYVFNVYLAVFLVELLYKIYTKTGIFFLNPCHITTSLQLLLLKMPENHPLTTQLFRLNMYTMPGALIALAFPILNTRQMIGEVFIYFLQHTLIVLVPLYLIYLGGAFLPESGSNYAWPIFSMSLILLYHFLVLQPISFMTHVNLNCILCPGVSDPFAGRLYRLFAVGHQFLVVPIVTKLYAFSSFYLVSVAEICVGPKVENLAKTE